MRGFHGTADGIAIKFGVEDARLLANLATQVASLIADRDDHASDLALGRLFPAAYRDNDADAAEFRRFTEEELADEKVGNALSMARALESSDTDSTVRVTLDQAAAVSWLRSFTDLRLALAARLGIEAETETETEREADPEETETFDNEVSRYTMAIYNWLGELQYSLVSAVDK